MTRRTRKGLQVGRGERYALIPREVLESASYHALTDWARTVLIAILAQFNGANNGCLALPFSQARELGVSHQWKLYAGLRVLEAADLIVCTRRGHLERGTKLPSLYAMTWRGIDEPRGDVVYDLGSSMCPLASNAWARWKRPDNWQQFCRSTARENHGRGKRIPVSTMGGYGRSTTRGAMSSETAQPVVDIETVFSAQPVVDASETSAVGPGGAA